MGDLIGDLREIVENARSSAAQAVNSGLTLMYWHVGRRINEELLGNRRAEYGKQVVAEVSRRLRMEYGAGFEERTIRRMMRFARQFADLNILTPLVSKLSWSHFLLVMPVKDETAREFYITMASAERWSKRTLQEKIDSMLYERTAIASKPEELARRELAALREENRTSPDLVFKSPYFLEFTGLKGMYSEKVWGYSCERLANSPHPRATPH